MNTLPSGEYLMDAIDKIKHFNIAAYLINCSSANITTEGIKLLSNEVDLPFGGYANPLNVTNIKHNEGEDDNVEYLQELYQQDIDANQYCDVVAEWINNGATIVGSCCGTSPEHIKKIYNLINNQLN